MKGQNAGVILGILFAFFIIALVSTDLNSWSYKLNCENYVTYSDWNVPQSGASSGFGSFEPSTTSTGTVQAFGTHPFIGTSYGFPYSSGYTEGIDIVTHEAVAGNPYSNVWKSKANTICDKAIAGSYLLNGVLVIFGSIIFVFVILRFIPFAGMGSE